MTIVHVFSKYPNINQPYNGQLIGRLRNAGLNCKVLSFGPIEKGYGQDVISVAHKKSNWPQYFFRVLMNYNLFKEYKRRTGLNTKMAIKYFGRFSVLLKHNPHCIHLHHIQLLRPRFLNFLDTAKLHFVVSVRGGDILVRPLRSEVEEAYLRNVLTRIKNLHFISQDLRTKLRNFTDRTFNEFVIKRSVEVSEPIKMVVSNNPKPIITTIGRIHWTKGYLEAIKALAIVKDEGIDFEYHICGGYTNEQIDELKFWIHNYKFHEKVIFHGHLNSDKLNDILSKTDIYLQPSLSEGIPNTLLRALFNNIPTITTNAGGIPEVFRDQIDGFMVEKGNIEALAESLKKMLLNQELCLSIKKNNMSSIHDESAEIESYKSMYQSIIDNNRI